MVEGRESGPTYKEDGGVNTYESYVPNSDLCQ